jgi:hypothetical protein
MFFVISKKRMKKGKIFLCICKAMENWKCCSGIILSRGVQKYLSVVHLLILKEGLEKLWFFEHLILMRPNNQFGLDVLNLRVFLVSFINCVKFIISPFRKFTKKLLILKFGWLHFTFPYLVSRYLWMPPTCSFLKTNYAECQFKYLMWRSTKMTLLLLIHAQKFSEEKIQNIWISDFTTCDKMWVFILILGGKFFHKGRTGGFQLKRRTCPPKGGLLVTLS